MEKQVPTEMIAYAYTVIRALHTYLENSCLLAAYQFHDNVTVILILVYFKAIVESLAVWISLIDLDLTEELLHFFKNFFRISCGIHCPHKVNGIIMINNRHCGIHISFKSLL